MTPVALLGKKKKQEKKNRLKQMECSLMCFYMMFFFSWNNIHGRGLECGDG